MAMDATPASALTRSAKRLKELASDAVTIPTTRELADRKAADLADARRKLDSIASRQTKIEATQQRRSGDVDGISREKADWIALVDRLERESVLLETTLQAEKPKPELTPAQKIRVDATTMPPPSGRWQPGTPEELKEARAEVDELARRCREARMSGSLAAEEKLTPALNAARIKLAVIEGPPLPAHAPWLTKETLAQALKQRGVVQWRTF